MHSSYFNKKIHNFSKDFTISTNLLRENTSGKQVILFTSKKETSAPEAENRNFPHEQWIIEFGMSRNDSKGEYRYVVLLYGDSPEAIKEAASEKTR